MDATHLHLILTHVPIVGTLFGTAILAYGLYANNTDLKKTAVVTFILMALLTIPVFLTGSAAEETVETIPGVTENLIENHEEWAEKALWGIGFLGVLAIITGYAILKTRAFAKTMSVITLIVSLGTFGLFAKVGNEGGKIRHSEIRTTNLNNATNLFNSDDDGDDD